jgi:3-phenylpropionate/trans-cinnamate dioxygenase ferredoxin subunit
MSYLKAVEKQEVPNGSMKTVMLRDKEILVVNVDGTYYAIGGRCPHAKADLSEGTLEGSILTCPRHGSRFDVTNGKAISGPKILFIRVGVGDAQSYEVKVKDDDVLIKLE